MPPYDLEALDALKSVCQRISLNLPANCPWRWDKEFNLALTVIDRQDEIMVELPMNLEFAYKWDFSSIGDADAPVVPPSEFSPDGVGEKPRPNRLGIPGNDRVGVAAASSGARATWIPPSTTGTPRFRYSAAILYPRRAVKVWIVMAARSTASSYSMVSTRSSMSRVWWSGGVVTENGLQTRASKRPVGRQKSRKHAVRPNADLRFVTRDASRDGHPIGRRIDYR